MTDARLTLRDFLPSDRDSLLDFVRDPGQLKYMLFDLNTEPEVDEFLALAQAQAASPDRTQWHWAVELEGVPGVVGSVALMKDTPATAELGYWLKRAVWGQGCATEASRFALDFGFHTLGLHRVWGKCHVENPASARVMEHLGMAREGLLREHVWLRDHFRSSFLYAILDRDYCGETS